MPQIPTYDEYVASLGRLTAHIDPTATTPEAIAIKGFAASLAELPVINIDSLTAWVEEDPRGVEVLGLAVGLGNERLINVMKDTFDVGGWIKFGKTDARRIVEMLDVDFDLVRMLVTQLDRDYGFGDVLVARAGPRVVATGAGRSGRKVEDEIEGIAEDLGLKHRERTRFVGRNNRDAPCDLAIVDDAGNAHIVVAAKGNDSTGSKLSDAVREILEMADVRLPRQTVYVVVDGIGWKRRGADLRRIYKLWEDQAIDGMYTLASLDRFTDDLEQAARLRGLLPSAQ